MVPILQHLVTEKIRGGDYKPSGRGTRPPNILLGERKGKCPPLIDQNAYFGEELKGFCIIKIKFLFSFSGGAICPFDPLTRGSAPGPHWGLRPDPHHSEEIAATGKKLPLLRSAAES